MTTRLKSIESRGGGRVEIRDEIYPKTAAKQETHHICVCNECRSEALKPETCSLSAGLATENRPQPTNRWEQQEGTRPTVKRIEPLFSTLECNDSPLDPAGERAVEWIEGLRQFQGRWKGAPLYLMEWQKEIVRELFGRLNDDGTRLYRTCYVEAPRKSGKSTLAAAIGLYLAMADDEPSPEVYFAAYDRDQARICYDMARYILEQDPELLDTVAVYLSRHEIQTLHNPGGKLKPLSRENMKQFGLNVHGLIYDEVMTLKSREMWDALTTAQGSREQPLTFAITTAGWERVSLCYELHELTRQIAEKAAEDPTFLGVVYGAPEDADWTDEEVSEGGQPVTRRDGFGQLLSREGDPSSQPADRAERIPDALALPVGRTGRALLRDGCVG